MRGFLVLLAHIAVRFALMLAMVALAPPARADATRPAAGVFKCAGDRGVPVYQGIPCPPGSELRDLVADPANLSVVELSPPTRASTATVATASPRRERAARPPTRASAASTPADPAERRHVKAGMSEGEVLARLGAPDAAAARHGRQARWTYLPAPGDPQTVTTIRFEDGRVSTVERALVR